MTPGRRRLLVLARRAWLVLLAAAVVAVLVRSGPDLGRAVDGARLPVLAVVPVLALGQLVLTSLLWQRALRVLGSPVTLAASLEATATSAPARYLPGSVWYAATRVTLLRRQGAGLRALSAVATLETVLVPVVGVGLGAAVLALAGGAGRADAAVSVPAGLLALALLVAATPPVVNRALAFRAGDAEVPVLSWSALLRVLVWVVLYWVWAGGVFAVYVAAFPSLELGGALTVAAAYGVAWGAGWLAVFAPQGVGVFEVTVVALLGGGAELAFALAGFRVLVLARDLLAGGLVLVVRRGRGPAGEPSAAGVVVDEVAPAPPEQVPPAR